MLLFLVLCVCLKTLQGTPLPPPPASSPLATATVSSVLAGSECCDDGPGGEQLRTVYTIVRSCLLTIVACVWTSMHPNINGPRDSWWTCTRRKLVMMAYTILAPELVLFWAFYQRDAAQQIAGRYNGEFARPGEMNTGLWRTLVGLFRPLPRETTWRGDGQSWTAAHGFFIQMGGFILYDNGYPVEVLDYPRLEDLLRRKCIDLPTVTERDLQDRSKGNAVSKAIIVLQTAWFVFQCGARVRHRLPLSELEVLTLAFAVMNAAIYVVWWEKPQGVDMAICIPLKSADLEADVADCTTPLPLRTDEAADQDPSHLEPMAIDVPLAEYRHFNNELPLIPPHEDTRDRRTRKKHIWLQQVLRTDRKQLTSPFFSPLRILLRVLRALLRPLNKMGEIARLEREQLRVPMFYSADVGYSFNLSAATCVLGVVFGAIHLLAWASSFPAPADRVLWRVSAVVFTVEPLLVVAALVVEDMGMVVTDIIAYFLDYSFFFLIPVYIAGRAAVVIIALQAIRHPPHSVLLDIAWTKYIPHF